MALASVQYQKDKIDYFELGNEPTNYPSSRWNFSTDAYVAQWKQWTSQIDAAVNEAVGANESAFPSERWWASSATTDQTGLHVRPADIIPAGINSDNQVAQYSIHSYEFCEFESSPATVLCSFSSECSRIYHIRTHSRLLTGTSDSKQLSDTI